MRSRISLVIILISIVLLIFMTIKGVKIGGLEVLSISQLQEKNVELENKIQEATHVATVQYDESTDVLKQTFDEYTVQKKKYEELASVTSKGNENLYETKQYDIGYLWRVLGKYATNRNITLEIDVKKNTKKESQYDFNFTVSGEYTDVSRFITDIENDSDLYFRIYNFNANGKTIQEQVGDAVVDRIITIATFAVKNINIDPSTIVQTATIQSDGN